RDRGFQGAAPDSDGPGAGGAALAEGLPRQDAEDGDERDGEGDSDVPATEDGALHTWAPLRQQGAWCGGQAAYEEIVPRHGRPPQPPRVEGLAGPDETVQRGVEFRGETGAIARGKGGGAAQDGGIAEVAQVAVEVAGGEGVADAVGGELAAAKVEAL